MTSWKDKLEDDIVLTGPGGRIIVNFRSYYELLKWLITEYVGVTELEADACMERRFDYFDNFDLTVTRVTLESHSWPYCDLDMGFYLIDHPEASAIKPSPDTQNGIKLYMEIENRIMREHALKDPFDYEGWE